MGLAFMLLGIAVAAEVTATAALPRAEGFTHPGWTIAVLAGYGLAIWLLTIIVRTLPVSVTYAIWAGLGTAAIAVVGALFLGESLSPVKITALGMIVVGVVVLNLQGAH